MPFLQHNLGETFVWLRDYRPTHSVKSAVQGSLKKAGEKNPAQIILFCQRHIMNPAIGV